MNIYNYKELSPSAIAELCRRRDAFSASVTAAVDSIREQVVREGDAALIRLTAELDGARLTDLRVSAEEFEKAERLVDENLKQAIKTAQQNVEKFHRFQVPQRVSEKIETTAGIFCWQEFRAIQKVGLYVPGGTAPLFSTVLMLGIPARIAGCEEICMCTPPGKNGEIAPEILWTARQLEIETIYKVGGAQAIFAMSRGTRTIAKVDKIFGPGNAYVTAAKISVSRSTAIDMPAGPSEVLVIADADSNADFVAADLLSQAEHGTDSLAVLVCTDIQKAQEVSGKVQEQLKTLPRKEIAKQSLEKSFIVLVEALDEAVAFSNLYAPEHLILVTDEFEKLAPRINNAGSVFCGQYTPESLGDYASGTNHTLPTSGFAKSCSGLSVSDFGKWVTFQTATRDGLRRLGPIVELMADREGLVAHKQASEFRRQ